MKVDRIKWRFCKAIACQNLTGTECKVEQCEHLDIAKALEERRAELKAVKYG